MSAVAPGFRRLSAYGYSNLPHNQEYIRLLIVEPGEKEDYIHCHLDPVPLLDVKGTYECPLTSPIPELFGLEDF